MDYVWDKMGRWDRFYEIRDFVPKWDKKWDKKIWLSIEDLEGPGTKRKTTKENKGTALKLNIWVARAQLFQLEIQSVGLRAGHHPAIEVE